MQIFVPDGLLVNVWAAELLAKQITSISVSIKLIVINVKYYILELVFRLGRACATSSGLL